VQAAIDRLPQQASSSIEQVIVNARQQGLDDLVEACQEELRVRGALTLSASDAEQAAKIGARVAGMALREVIELAFKEVPPKPEERLIINRIAQHPGTSYQDLNAVYRKGDLSLVIGHLVYYRFGYFRPMLTGRTQSDILLERDSSKPSVCYRIRPDALAAFDALGLLEQSL
jgi:hypothetical protein